MVIQRCLPPQVPTEEGESEDGFIPQLERCPLSQDTPGEDTLRKESFKPCPPLRTTSGTGHIWPPGFTCLRQNDPFGAGLLPSEPHISFPEQGKEAFDPLRAFVRTHCWHLSLLAG